MEQPGLVERVDHLTGAVADLAFKLDTLISSTTAFRDSFGDRMTDYADLVAHWSIETEQNLANHRRAADRVTDELRRAVADQDAALARMAALVEGLAEALAKAEERISGAVEAVGGEVQDAARAQGQALRALVAAEDGDDVLEGVRAELGALREAVAGAGELRSVQAELAALREEVATGGPAVSLGEELAELRRAVAAVDEQVTGGGAGPSIREELTAVREALGGGDGLDVVRRELAALHQAVAADSALDVLGTEVAALRDSVAAMAEAVTGEPTQADALAAVLAEVAGLRKDVPEAVAALGPGGDVAALAEEVRGLRRDLARLPDGEAELGRVAAELRELRELMAEEDVEAVEDDASFAAALGEQLASLRADVSRLADAGAPDLVTVAEDLAALRGEVARIAEQVAVRPPVPPEVLALTAELQALRTEMEQEPAGAGSGAEPASAAVDERLHETLAELVFEVRALRRRFPVRATDPPAEAQAEPATPKRRRPRSSPS